MTQMTHESLACAMPLVAAVLIGLAGCSAATSSTNTASPTPLVASDAELLARGEYLTRIAGCNDCHTPGYAEKSGELPKAGWLVGNSEGFNGPWGTTYPVNLRLKLQDMDEAAWLKYSGQLHTRPPMPDFAVRAMHEDDRRAIYRFIRSLGPAGVKAPDYLPPGQMPSPPYMQFVLPPAQPPASTAG
ncbi:MAG: cytochrome C [Thermomonas sp.]